MPDVVERMRSGDLGFVDDDALTAFVSERRWFGSRHTGPAHATIARAVPVSDQPVLVNVIVELTLRTGTVELYQLVVGLRPPDGPATSTIQAVGDMDLYDALDDPHASGALVAAMRASTWFGDDEARIEFHSSVGADRFDPLPRSGRPAGHDQTNTSVIFDDRLIFKWYRRVEPGIHPEVELLRFLADHAFPHTPPLLGWVEHRGLPVDATLAVMQEFERDGRDGWEYVMERLAGGGGEALLDDLEALGRVTGELHQVLASERDDPAFVPEEVSSEGLALMSAALDEITGEVFGALPTTGEFAALAGRDDEVRARLRGVSTTTGLGRKIRVHGDLHLGQALRVTDGWRLIDFEGEPARPVNERRRKRSPLRDVAGLLRSIEYVAMAAQRHHGIDVPSTWLQQARSRVVEGYVDVVESTGLLPPTSAVTREVLALYELEKAVYELRYELAHRPEWAPIPAAGIAALLSEAG